MAIHFKTESGYCLIFNIYNNCRNNNSTDALHTYLRVNLASVLPLSTDHIFWIGDFNRHHPLWEKDRNCRLYNPPHLINPLMDIIQEFDMVLALPPGIPTYKMVTGNWTRPDNIWHSNNPSNPIITCNIKPSIQPPWADHLPIITLLDLTVTWVIRLPSCNMHCANFTSINKKLCTHLDERNPALLKLCCSECSSEVKGYYRCRSIYSRDETGSLLDQIWLSSFI